MDYKQIIESVKELVIEAGEKIVTSQFCSIISKEGKHNYMTEMDKCISLLLEEELPKILSDSIVISEEMDEEKHLNNSYHWIVDPIDGTTNYIHDFRLSCISVGLMKEQSPVLGVVYNPFTKEMFWAIKGYGAYLGDNRIRVNDSKTISEALILAETNPYGNRMDNKSFRNMEKFFETCVDIRITGSAALDICYIASGRGAGFFTEVLYPWDIAAGHIILMEAGGRATHFDGTPLNYKSKENIIASNTMIHEEMISYLAGCCTK